MPHLSEWRPINSRFSWTGDWGAGHEGYPPPDCSGQGEWQSILASNWAGVFGTSAWAVVYVTQVYVYTNVHICEHCAHMCMCMYVSVCMYMHMDAYVRL